MRNFVKVDSMSKHNGKTPAPEHEISRFPTDLTLTMIPFKVNVK